MQTRDIRPFPLVEDTGSRHEDVGDVLERFVAVHVLDLDVPFGRLFIPACFCDFVLELHVFLDPVFVGHALPVLEDFPLGSVELAPLGTGLKAELVGMCGNVACTAGISVLKPCSADVCVLFVDRQLEIRHVFGELDCSADARDAGSSVDDFQRSRFIDGALRDEWVGELAIWDFVASRPHGHKPGRRSCWTSLNESGKARDLELGEYKRYGQPAKNRSNNPGTSSSKRWRNCSRRWWPVSSKV